jgi:hypothetical protein
MYFKHGDIVVGTLFLTVSCVINYLVDHANASVDSIKGIGNGSSGCLDCSKDSAEGHACVCHTKLLLINDPEAA